MKIKVLGSNCVKCDNLLKNTRQAVEQLGLGIEVNKEIELDKIVSYGVMTIPALVINEKVVSVGKALAVDKIIELIKAAE